MGGSVYLFFDFIFAQYSPTSIVAQHATFPTPISHGGERLSK
jgi:hypothetical protein